MRQVTHHSSEMGFQLRAILPPLLNQLANVAAAALVAVLCFFIVLHFIVDRPSPLYTVYTTNSIVVPVWLVVIISSSSISDSYKPQLVGATMIFVGSLCSTVLLDNWLTCNVYVFCCNSWMFQMTVVPNMYYPTTSTTVCIHCQYWHQFHMLTI